MYEDFKSWWARVEIFGGEGCMDAAEQAWDEQQRKIDALERCLKEADDVIEKWDNLFLDMPADPREV
jgi:hypothetical protein